MIDALKALARSLGLDLCGVAPAEPPPRSGYFESWLTAGKAGTMDWLARSAAKRCRPDLVLPGVRSVVAVGLNYWQGLEAHDSAEGKVRTISPLQGRKGRIARYAHGFDYHVLMESRLQEIARFLSEQGGTQRCYVDTGPVLERELASLAGIGWQGKNTMLIHPQLGTWLLLGVVLTTLDLPVDSPMADHCGKCTRCIRACPTDAITAPYQLDATRCISYLTIEFREAIPEQFRPLIGDRIFGCDECLDVCPWNRFAAASHQTSFQLRPEIRRITLRDFLRLDDKGFRELFRGSPIRRTKRRGFLRNVCVALGNIGGPDDLPALEKAASEPEPLISEHARWAAARIRRRHSIK